MEELLDTAADICPRLTVAKPKESKQMKPEGAESQIMEHNYHHVNKTVVLNYKLFIINNNMRQ